MFWFVCLFVKNRGGQKSRSRSPSVGLGPPPARPPRTAGVAPRESPEVLCLELPRCFLLLVPLLRPPPPPEPEPPLPLPPLPELVLVAASPLPLFPFPPAETDHLREEGGDWRLPPVALLSLLPPPPPRLPLPPPRRPLLPAPPPFPLAEGSHPSSPLNTGSLHDAR